MSGFKFLLNNRELAAVSIHKRNIITAYIAGDIVGPELATGHLIGGYYGEPEETTHRGPIHNRANSNPRSSSSVSTTGLVFMLLPRALAIT